MDNLDEYHKQEMSDMFTDAGFLYGTRKTIDYFLAQNMTVYEYILTYQGEFSLSEVFGVSPEGVCHGDDLLYLWDPVSPLGNISQPLDLQVRGFSCISLDKLCYIWEPNSSRFNCSLGALRHFSQLLEHIWLDSEHGSQC